MWKRSGSKMGVQFTTIIINVKLKPDRVFNFYNLLFVTLFRDLFQFVNSKQNKNLQQKCIR